MLEEEIAILFLKETQGMNEDQARAEVERLKQRDEYSATGDKDANK